MSEATEVKTESSAELAKSNLLVAGHGHCGVNSVLETLRRSDPAKDTYLGTMVIESNKRALSSFTEGKDKKECGFLSKWLTLPERFKCIQIGDTGLGTGGDTAEGERMAKAKLGLIIPYLREFDNVIQIGGGGGGTCGSMPVIAEVLQGLDIPTYAMLTMPTIMEGPKRAARARTVLTRMRGICPTLTINNQQVPNKDLSPSKIQREINEMSIFWALPFLKSLLQEYCEVQDPDGNDWKKWTKVGKYTTIGHFNASKGFKGYEEGLLGNPYLDSRIIKKALALGFLFKGKWPYRMIEEVIGFVSSKVQDTNQNEEFELKWGSKEEGVQKGVRTVGFVAFAKEGPDEEEQRMTRVVAIEREVPPVYAQAESRIPDTTNNSNGNGNHNGNGHKIPFAGNINNKHQSAIASPELVAEYHSLFSQTPSPELWNRARTVQQKLQEDTKDQTQGGFLFDVPTKPEPINWK
jgi:cell division GTPase FtsZ